MQFLQSKLYKENWTKKKYKAGISLCSKKPFDCILKRQNSLHRYDPYLKTESAELHNYWRPYGNEIALLQDCHIACFLLTPCVWLSSPPPVFVYTWTSQCKLLIVGSWGRAIRVSCHLRLAVTIFPVLCFIFSHSRPASAPRLPFLCTHSSNVMDYLTNVAAPDNCCLSWLWILFWGKKKKCCRGDNSADTHRGSLTRVRALQRGRSTVLRLLLIASLCMCTSWGKWWICSPCLWMCLTNTQE